MFLKINIWICTFLLAGFVSAQDLTQDLSRIISSMDSLSTVSIKVKVDVYSRQGGSRIYSSKASIQKNSTSSLNILGEQENFENQKYRISVDHEEKSILILKKTGKKDNKTPIDPADLKKLKSLFETERASSPKPVIKMISNISGKKTYSVTNHLDFREIQIVLDMTHLAIEKVIYHYKEESEFNGQYILLDYTEFRKGQDLRSTLSTSRYFTIEKDKYVLKPAYQGYKIYTDL